MYNGDGVLRAQYKYNSWGKVLSVTDENGNAITSATHVGNLNPFRYRGYYYDTESGFYYLMSRYYDPVTHRFINADDRINGNTGILGSNVFAYCNNNPIMNYDPNGHSLLAAFLVVVAAICTASSNTKTSSNNNKRPNTGNPNSTYKAPNGDKRTYDSDGKPKQDYDHSDHGYPDKHPHDENGGHYHDWDWSDNKPWAGDSPRGPAYVPIVGIVTVVACVVGIVIIAADDVTGIGVADDVLLPPLGAGIAEGIVMIMGG